MRRMFAEIDADIYVVTDGDATYDATRAPAMIERLTRDDLDVVTGIRDHGDRDAAYRRGHQFGNRAFNLAARPAVRRAAGRHVLRLPRDVAPFRQVVSRRKRRGFEIETELTVHALELRVPTAEVVTSYFERPEGSTSKLSTYRDGLRILYTMARLFRDVRPLPFFFGFRARCSRWPGSCWAPKSSSNILDTRSCRVCRLRFSRPASCCSRRCRSSAE